MKEYTLEHEFDFYKRRHKITILQAKMTVYYRDLQKSRIKIPFFMQKPPEKRAEKEVKNLFKKNIEVFESLYLQAWDEVAECLP